MAKQSLLYSNPYLRDPQKRDLLLKKSIVSSSAIEGIHAAVAKALGLGHAKPTSRTRPKKTAQQHRKRSFP